MGASSKRCCGCTINVNSSVADERDNPVCRHIDVSSQRGNEAEIGHALSEIYSDWLVNRPDTWITGKVWPEGEACPSPAHVRSQVSATLAALKVDYLDLCLLPAHSDTNTLKVSQHMCLHSIALSRELLFPLKGLMGRSCMRSFTWCYEQRCGPSSD